MNDVDPVACLVAHRTPGSLLLLFIHLPRYDEENVDGVAAPADQRSLYESAEVGRPPSHERIAGIVRKQIPGRKHRNMIAEIGRSAAVPLECDDLQLTVW